MAGICDREGCEAEDAHLSIDEILLQILGWTTWNTEDAILYTY